MVLNRESGWIKANLTHPAYIRLEVLELLDEIFAFLKGLEFGEVVDVLKHHS